MAVGVVANAMNDLGCQNHVCLVLTGEQGKFKTTWLDNLCPRSLASYLFTGKIDPQNKDVLTLVAEYLFINIDDQLKALNKRDENELKTSSRLLRSNTGDPTTFTSKSIPTWRASWPR